jgi:hypothetical protein
MIQARKLSPLLLPLAGMAVMAILALTLLLHTATHAAPVPVIKPSKTQQQSHKTQQQSHAIVTIVYATHTTAARFSPATENLTHDAAGKASIHFVNKTATSQTIINQGNGKTYRLNPNASAVVPLRARTTTIFKLGSNAAATPLTVNVN